MERPQYGQAVGLWEGAWLTEGMVRLIFMVVAAALFFSESRNDLRTSDSTPGSAAATTSYRLRDGYAYSGGHWDRRKRKLPLRVGELDRELDLDGSIEGQFGDAYCGTGVEPLLTEETTQK